MFMHANTVLEVDEISKLFSRSALESQQRLGQIVRAASLGRDFVVSNLREKEFWALDKISFDLKRGEAIGIIGLNGAGKTTLLRMLNGQFPPDKGEIRIAGKTASMIDLTEGFNNRMNGRENIYLRSATLGRTREEVDANIDEIINFTELGDAIAAPIATYSAGMRMRLAFASTIFVNPDLLIIDEILSVGDFRFRQKCLERIRMLREQSAFVFASHSMNDVARFCNKAIVLRKGEIVFQGDPEDAIKFYTQEQEQDTKTPLVKPPALGHFIKNDNAVNNTSVRFLNEAGQEAHQFRRGEVLIAEIVVNINYQAQDLTIGLPLWDSEDIMVTAFATKADKISIAVEPEKEKLIKLSIDTSQLNPGSYKTVLVVRDGPEFLMREQGPDFTIDDPDLMLHWGKVQINHDWEIAD